MNYVKIELMKMASVLTMLLLLVWGQARAETCSIRCISAPSGMAASMMQGTEISGCHSNNEAASVKGTQISKHQKCSHSSCEKDLWLTVQERLIYKSVHSLAHSEIIILPSSHLFGSEFALSVFLSLAQLTPHRSSTLVALHTVLRV